MKIIAALTEPAAIRAYLDGVCLDSRPRPASTPYPAYLNTPQSAGLSVRWMRAESGPDGGVSAFRWEVGGKCRFYDPPDPPIPPDDLMSYEFVE